MISVLCPSRKRPDLLNRSLQSLQERVRGPELVEYLVAFDPDDPQTLHAAESVGARAVVCNRFGYARLDRYYDRLWRSAVGSWMLLWNDDALMTTDAWNQLIEALPQRCLVADLHTDMSDAGVCAFPCVRLEAIEAIGDWSPHTSHSDSYWQDLGRMTGTIFSVSAHVHHDRFDLTGNNDDETYREGRTGYRSQEYYAQHVQRCIRDDADTLMEVLSDPR